MATDAMSANASPRPYLVRPCTHAPRPECAACLQAPYACRLCMPDPGCVHAFHPQGLSGSPAHLDPVGSWQAASGTHPLDAELPFFTDKPIKTGSCLGVQRAASFSGLPSASHILPSREGSLHGDGVFGTSPGSVPITPSALTPRSSGLFGDMVIQGSDSPHVLMDGMCSPHTFSGLGQVSGRAAGGWRGGDAKRRLSAHICTQLNWQAHHPQACCHACG